MYEWMKIISASILLLASVDSQAGKTSSACADCDAAVGAVNEMNHSASTRTSPPTRESSGIDNPRAANPEHQESYNFQQAVNSGNILHSMPSPAPANGNTGQTTGGGTVQK